MATIYVVDDEPVFGEAVAVIAETRTRPSRPAPAAMRAEWFILALPVVVVVL